MTFLSVEQLEGRASSTDGIAVDFVRDWRQAASRLAAGGHRTAFQHAHWLGAWYEAFRDVSPIIAVISDVATAQDIALVPLIGRTRGGTRIVEFADLGVSDNNAPILMQDEPFDAVRARTISKALVSALRALPDGFDLLRMAKMPAHVGGRPNPLVSFGRLGSSSLNGNVVLMGDDYAAYETSIRRMQLRRSWRLFSRHPGARFEIAKDVEHAHRFLDVMDIQQQERMKQLRLDFVLNDDSHARFYRDVVRRGLAEGYAVVSALVCDEGIIATALGVRSGPNYFLLRTSNAGRPWLNCSPGLLTIERTFAALHARGVRRFDLSIGNYDYKRRFGAVPLALTDVSVALSWRGVPLRLRDGAVHRLRDYPRLFALAARLLGKPAR